MDGIVGSLTRAKDGSIVGRYEDQISEPETAHNCQHEPASQNGQQASTENAAGIDSENPSTDILPLAGLSFERLEILNSRLKFIDQSVSPETTLALTNINLSMNPVSITQDQHYTFVASHQTDDTRNATLESKGVVNLSTPISGKVDLKLRNFEMHEIGAYMGGVQSGRLTLSTGVNVDSGTVHLKNNILIESMKRSQAAATNAENLTGNGTSAALALYLLKDKKGNVELSVPIETDLENFSLGTQDIVSKALRGAAQKAALNYAKFVLQPYGSLLLLKDIAGVIAKPRFEPIVFEPGAAAVAENAAAYTAKIAQLLAQKPDVRIAISGVSTLLDTPKATDNLNANCRLKTENIETQSEINPQTPDGAFFLALAKQREDNIRQAVQGYGIEGTRTFSCKPIFEKTTTKVRVELSL